jgi:hypothetical protein
MSQILVFYSPSPPHTPQASIFLVDPILRSHPTLYRMSRIKGEKLMKRYYYSNEVLFLLWTEEFFHLCAPSQLFFHPPRIFSMSHVYKRHKN